MVDFSKKFDNYIKLPHFGYKPSQNAKNDSVSFIKTGILSIFDGSLKNRSCTDGKIDSQEFKNISEQDYNKYVQQMKSYYKSTNNRELEYHIPTYNELEQMLKEEGANNRFLSFKKQEITPDEIEEPIVPNKRLGQTNQAGSGECYQDTSNIALSYKDKGMELLNRSVKPNFVTGGYNVTLYGAKQDGKKVPVTYHFTQEELKEAQEKYVKFKSGAISKKYASGDANLVLMDLAIEKYRKENGHKLLHRNTKGVKGFDDYLSSGFIADNLELITGKSGHRQIYSGRKDIEKVVDGKMTQEHTYLIRADKDAKLGPMLRSLQANPNRIAGCTFGVTKEGNWKEFKQNGLYESHACVIKSVDLKNNKVVIVDPHEGKNEPKELSLEVFKKYISRIDWIDA